MNSLWSSVVRGMASVVDSVCDRQRRSRHFCAAFRLLKRKEMSISLNPFRLLERRKMSISLNAFRLLKRRKNEYQFKRV